jgi:hypothetical protein
MDKFRRRLDFLRRRKRFESDLEEEMRFHLDMKSREGIEAGLPEEDARCRALRQFGNTLNLRERSRDVWIISAVETLSQDLRFAIRMLRNSPLFSVMSLLGLGLGIGLSTAVFAFVNAIVLRTLRQIKDPATYVFVGKSNDEGFSYSDYAYLRYHTTVLTALTGASSRIKLIGNVQPSSEPEEIDGRLISADAFRVSGEEPSLGRAFLPEEDRTSGSHPVVILSRGFWRLRFGADPGVIGKNLRLNGDLFTVIGVTEANGDSVAGDEGRSAGGAAL